MKMFLFLIVLVSCVSSQTMDSLMRRSLVAEMKAGRVTGYVFSHGQQPVQLMPPDRLFGNRTSNLTPLTHFSATTNYEALQKEVNDLKVEQEKTSFIIESLIKQSESHTKNNDFILKLIEIIMGGIVTVTTAYVLAKIKKKK